MYSPGARCREILEAVKGLGIGEGVEVDCVMHASLVVGVELRYSCIYGGTFRRVMSKPYPGGLLSINLDALGEKYREMLGIREMYRGIKKGTASPLLSLWAGRNEV